VLRHDGPRPDGPDPSGDYSLERTVRLTERFVDALGLTRFAIGGTSIGGTVAMHYTAAHPERVERLILLSPGALEGRSMQRAGRSVPRRQHPRVHHPGRCEVHADEPLRPPADDELIDQWYEMWPGKVSAGDTGGWTYSSADLAKVMAGVRVRRSSGAENAGRAGGELRKYGQAPEVRVITYPGVGHMAADEAGPVIARDVRTYLDGGG
jgi:pimeloyl-ACP methyl ester carboxylesterase